MRSRADLMHLDFIIGGWNMLRYHSLLSAEGDGRQPQNPTKQGLSSIFPHVWGFAFHLPLIFPFVIRITSFLSPRLPLKCCVFMQNPCLAYLSRLKWRLKCFNFKSASLGWFPPFPPPFTLLRKFLLPLPCLADAPEKSELSQSSPRLAPRTEST